MTGNGMGGQPGEPSPDVSPDVAPAAAPPADTPAYPPAGDPFADPARTVILETLPELRTRSTGRRAHCVALLPGVSGVDTTATAAGLALALASMSAADVLLLDCDSALPGTGLCVRFGLVAPGPGAMLPVAPRLTYRPTAAEELATPWPDRYALLLVHCGPGPSRDVLEAALTAADRALLLTPDCAAGTESASAALDWLSRGGWADLADGAVVALAAGNGTDPPGATETLAGRCRNVVRLPAEAHGVAPGVVDPALMPQAALDALAELAEEVAGA